MTTRHARQVGTDHGHRVGLRYPTASDGDAECGVIGSGPRLVEIVARLRGSRRVRAFPRGQFGPDSVELQTVFEPDELGSLFDLVRESPRVDSVEIFPRGIINPDVFSVRIGLR